MNLGLVRLDVMEILEHLNVVRVASWVSMKKPLWVNQPAFLAPNFSMRAAYIVSHQKNVICVHLAIFSIRFGSANPVVNFVRSAHNLAAVSNVIKDFP